MVTLLNVAFVRHLIASRKHRFWKTVICGQPWSTIVNETTPSPAARNLGINAPGFRNFRLLAKANSLKLYIIYYILHIRYYIL